MQQLTASQAGHGVRVNTDTSKSETRTVTAEHTTDVLVRNAFKDKELRPTSKFIEVIADIEGLVVVVCILIVDEFHHV